MSLREMEDVDEIPDAPVLDELADLEELPPAALVPAPPVDPVQQLEPKVGAMARLIANTKAVDDASYLVVCEQTKGIKLLIAEVDATFDPLVVAARQAVDDARAALEARKAALDQVRATKAKHRGPLEQAEATNKAEIARYVDAQERKVREAEAARIAEQKRQEEQAAEKRAAAVAQLADAGKPEEAAALASTPLPQPTAVVASKAQAAAAPKATGVTTSKAPKATVTDLAALIVAVADKLQQPEIAGPPLDVLAVGKAKLNAWATDRLAGPINGIAGIGITNASASVTDMRALVLELAGLLRTVGADGRSDSSGLLACFEHVPSVLNKWTTAQGTALNWPGVSVELVTEVSASRRG
jgi:septum formation inhibitor MinC